ncbi:MAG TPA: hypothetical protein DCZ38_02290 [Coxiellaceae bacterium]|nr:hypothetical protein [Coxiellaceae bacterium]HBG19164.1 hypothetical protein [Desulfobulbaceae bacterium]
MNLTLLDIILLLIINGGSIYFAGYLKEKSKNKAIAEDISNITRLIGEANAKFTEQSDKLKMELDVLGNTHISIIHEQRKAIIDFLASYLSWYNLILFTPADIVMKPTQIAIDEYRLKLDHHLNELLVKEMVFDIFVDSKKLISIKNSLKKNTIDNYKIFVDEFIVKITNLTIQHEIVMPSYDTQTQLIKLSELSQKILESFLLLNKLKSDNEKQLHDHRDLFYDNCKEYLYGMYGKKTGKKTAEIKEQHSL